MHASFPMVSPVLRPGELLRSKITGEADGRDVCMIVVLSETIDCDETHECRLGTTPSPRGTGYDESRYGRHEGRGWTVDDASLVFATR